MRETLPYPNGWFAIAFSRDLDPGSAIPRTAFGVDLVLWRATTGSVAAHEAYCPHLGAHLGVGGLVDADSIACPFHGWRFGRDGRCLEVPYERKTPPARLQSWPVQEQNGVVLLWHDAQDRAPAWQMPELDDEGWLPDTVREWALRSHPQEVCENGLDFAHLRTVHGANIVTAESPITIEGPALSVMTVPRTDTADPALPSVRLHNFVHGPGLVFAEIEQPGMKGRYRLYATPIDQEQITLRGMVSCKVEGDFDPAALQAQMANAVIAQWEQDIPIWQNKVHRTRPMLTASEASIAQYRRWYRQFYS